MPTYAIGDIHGCRSALQRLLQRIEFRPGRDRLLLTGDLVNRGEDSAGVLRWARDLGEGVVSVLGNHDLGLLATAEGVWSPRKRDHFSRILDEPDAPELCDWLRQRPLLHREGSFLLVHAGLLPSWSADSAESLAREAESLLRGKQGRDLMARVWEGAPEAWDDALAGLDRAALVLRAMTRLRTCTGEGRMCRGFSGPPEEAPPGCLPWYDVPGRRSRDATVVSGHWAALGLLLRDDVWALDTGCAWGGALTAVRLEDRAVFQVESSPH